MIDLNSLNANQRDAVLCIDHPSLVIAGAGSGKTRVLTYKIAYLLDSGYFPGSILALTFTKKAANEMKERIASIVGSNAANHIWMGTFHSVFMRILLREHDVIGFPSNFTIYDNTDSKNLVRDIIRELGLDEKVYKPADVFYRISVAKNNLIAPKQYLENQGLYEEDTRSGLSAIGQIYKIYWNRCRQSGVMDFDDLLVYTFLLFEKNEEIRKKYSQLFRYILVDEYQDTNFAQHCIILQLTKDNPNVCVVGDDAQSIYSFRGAKIDNILNFTRHFNDAKIFKLEQNYRSTQTIVSAANSLISKNRRQIPKVTYSERSVGNALQKIEAYTDVEEAAIVVNRIKSLISSGAQRGGIAILYRANSQSRMFEDELRKQGIPYKIYGGLSFYQRKEVKDVMAYFRLASNHNDEEAFKRVVNYPKRGIGNTTVEKILSSAIQQNVSMWEVASSPLKYNLAVSSGTASKLSSFCQLIESFSAEANSGVSAAELSKRIIRESGILREMQMATSIEDIGKKENIEELVNSIDSYCNEKMEETGHVISLYDYLTDVSLIADLEDKDDADGQKVNLMTVHASKGLEFDNVFVVGLEETLFPSIRGGYENPSSIEEERRLCYVAITRAKENCFLSYAKSRYKFGSMEFCRPSRFISDIDARYIEDMKRGKVLTQSFVKPAVVELPRLRRVVKSDKSQIQDKNYSSDFNLGVGDHISHERFGKGVVVKLEGEGDNTKATVDFENVGTKQLLLKYANFKKL